MGWCLENRTLPSGKSLASEPLFLVMCSREDMFLEDLLPRYVIKRKQKEKSSPCIIQKGKSSSFKCSEMLNFRGIKEKSE